MIEEKNYKTLEDYILRILDEAKEKVDNAYRERNDVVLGFAALASRYGWLVGVSHDDRDTCWPVLMIETPFGQMSWHLPKGDLPSSIPACSKEWDGHNTDEKYNRLRDLVKDSWS
jgi:hypothetical protein